MAVHGGVSIIVNNGDSIMNGFRQIDARGIWAGERRRFIVGKSTGWRPCHLEIKTARSACGDPARARYQSVKSLERVR